MVGYSCLVGKDLLVVGCVLWMYAVCYDHGQGEVIEAVEKCFDITGFMVLVS